MDAYKTNSPKQQAMTIIKVQCVVALLAMLYFLVKGAQGSVRSSFYGAVTAIAPTLVLIVKMFSLKNQTAKEMLNAFYKAEGLKWLLTIGLLFCFIKFFDIKAGPFFITFVAALLSYWVGLGLIFKK